MAKKPTITVQPLSTDHVMWLIDGKTYRTDIEKSMTCPFCGRTGVITGLPPPILAKQPDDTTHVCNPALGGCNHGFHKDP